MLHCTATAESLYQMSDRDGVCELVRGAVRRRPMLGYDEGRLLGQLGFQLVSFVADRGLGQFVDGRCGFLLSRSPDTVRAARLAFVQSNRAKVPADSGPFYPGPPDLAVEVISPTDRFGEIDEKVHDWLSHGCQVVWLVNPKGRTVTVYRGSTDIKVLTAAATLREPGLLPGVELPVSQIFDLPR